MDSQIRAAGIITDHEPYLPEGIPYLSVGNVTFYKLAFDPVANKQILHNCYCRGFLKKP